ncbi:MAG: hypothetical protein ACSW79_09215, partial [Eubacteriales bacterium]
QHLGGTDGCRQGEGKESLIRHPTGTPQKFLAGSAAAEPAFRMVPELPSIINKQTKPWHSVTFP